jgi:hypothetical protein
MSSDHPRVSLRSTRATSDRWLGHHPHPHPPLEGEGERVSKDRKAAALAPIPSGHFPLPFKGRVWVGMVSKDRKAEPPSSRAFDPVLPPLQGEGGDGVERSDSGAALFSSLRGSAPSPSRGGSGWGWCRKIGKQSPPLLEPSRQCSLPFKGRVWVGMVSRRESPPTTSPRSAPIASHSRLPLRRTQPHHPTQSFTPIPPT